MYVVRRRLQETGPAHDCKKRSENRTLTSPTPIRIQPTASMLMPFVVALTANVRIAPTAIRKIPTPSPIVPPCPLTVVPGGSSLTAEAPKRVRQQERRLLQ